MNNVEQVLESFRSAILSMALDKEKKRILRAVMEIPFLCRQIGMQAVGEPHLRATLLALYLRLTNQETRLALEMLQSSEAAERALEHRDLVVRGTALWILREVWLDSSDMLPILLRVLEQEPTLAVRLEALRLVARYYCGPNMDRRLCNQLAKLAVNKKRDRLERKVAYDMLLLAADRVFEFKRFSDLCIWMGIPDDLESHFDFSILNDYLQGET